MKDSRTAETRRRVRILFITRKFPPTRGSMEKAAYEIHKSLSPFTEVRLIKWGSSNKWLPLVLPCFLFKATWLLLVRQVDLIYLQDGLLAPLGALLMIFRKPVVITVHGLDITYRSSIYQCFVPRCVKRLDKVICVSHATKSECMRRGIPEGKITVIPNGVSDDFYLDSPRADLEEALRRKLGLDLGSKIVLLSVGRLVERKGLHWCIAEVIPRLLKERQDFVYFIAGQGTFEGKIQETIAKNRLQDYVVMLGKIDDDTRRILYNLADIFIMPNIPVEGDIEGFGLVALEAASCGLPVVASDLEGIRDAVKDGRNGFLVEPYNAERFAKFILELLKDDAKRGELRREVRSFTLDHCTWQSVGASYLSIFGELVEEAH